MGPLNDRRHLLHKEFELLPSGRRFKVPRCESKDCKNSFVPAAVTLMNKQEKLHNLSRVCVFFIYLFIGLEIFFPVVFILVQC